MVSRVIQNFWFIFLFLYPLWFPHASCFLEQDVFIIHKNQMSCFIKMQIPDCLPWYLEPLRLSTVSPKRIYVSKADCICTDPRICHKLSYLPILPWALISSSLAQNSYIYLYPSLLLYWHLQYFFQCDTVDNLLCRFSRTTRFFSQ